MALRRLKSPELAAFLGDSDPLVIAEAARAIHDESVDAALPKLATLRLDSLNTLLMLITPLAGFSEMLPEVVA